MSEEIACKKLHTRFVRGFMDITVLLMLVREPLWGYKLMREIWRRHEVKVGPSVIYPLLDSMEADGLIEGKEVLERRRRRTVYSVTEKGLAFLKCMENILDTMMK
jgi:DNA-binding PadR family transcriptional regulator